MWKVLGLQESGRVPADAAFHFRTCGPVIDPVLHETARLFGLDYRIVGRDHIDPQAEVIPVPRWDIDLARLAGGTSALPADGSGHPGPGQPSCFPGGIRHVRAAFLAKVAGTRAIDAEQRFRDKFLLLKRSPQPAYYDKGGLAEIPGYGLGRRSLVRLDETVSALQAEGLPVATFEPGSVSLADQITAFAGCTGVAGVFGAEFANIVWMPPGSVVIWVHTRAMARLPWMTRELAQLLRLQFLPVMAQNDKAPELPLEIIRRSLVQPG